MRKNLYVENGIRLTPTKVTKGDNVKISYDGILAQSGATDVYAHVGFGSNWDDARDYKMLKTLTGFEASIPITHPKPVNVCFKDSINNWDNNSGSNYTFDIVE